MGEVGWLVGGGVAEGAARGIRQIDFVPLLAAFLGECACVCV